MLSCWLAPGTESLEGRVAVEGRHVSHTLQARTSQCTTINSIDSNLDVAIDDYSECDILIGGNICSGIDISKAVLF